MGRDLPFVTRARWGGRQLARPSAYGSRGGCAPGRSWCRCTARCASPADPQAPSRRPSSTRVPIGTAGARSRPWGSSWASQPLRQRRTRPTARLSSSNASDTPRPCASHLSTRPTVPRAAEITRRTPPSAYGWEAVARLAGRFVEVCRARSSRAQAGLVRTWRRPRLSTSNRSPPCRGGVPDEREVIPDAFLRSPQLASSQRRPLSCRPYRG